MLKLENMLSLVKIERQIQKPGALAKREALAWAAVSAASGPAQGR